MKKATPENIHELLDRYLEGTNTQEELKALCEYFNKADNLPADLIPYAQMFALLDERPKTPSAEALDRFSAPLKEKRRLTSLWPLVAAACIAAFVFIFLTPPEKEENMAVAYMDGKIQTDPKIAMQIGQDALQEIFSNGNQEEQLKELFNEQ